MTRGKHRDNREPSPTTPMVFYQAGWWMRSGYPSRYDAYPVTAARQPKWQCTLAGRRA